MMIDMFDVVSDVFDAGDKSWIPAGPAFVYLYRRFGPPKHGSDSYKEVCNYLVPSAVDGMYVIIHIGGSNAHIGVTGTREWERQFILEAQRAGRRGESEFERQCRDAAKDVLRDLLRPVAVRDVHINILGKASGESLGEFVEQEGRMENEVEYSHMAGYGIVQDFYQDPDLYFDFVRFVRDKGGGDLIEGMKDLMEAASPEAKESER